MLVYTLLNDEGREIDATFELGHNHIIFHSRGGTKGTPSARNSDYAEGLRYIFSRLERSEHPIERVLVDSKKVQSLTLNERTVFTLNDGPKSVAEMFTQVTRTMAKVGQSTGSSGGNQTKRLKLELAGNTSVEPLLALLRGVRVKAQSRLTATDQNRVTAEHIWRAIQKLEDKPTNSNIEPNGHFYVVSDGNKKLSPNAVFSEALKLALNKEVGHRDFSVGIDSICFQTIKASGYDIIAKNENVPSNKVPLAPEDKIWAEGNQKRVSHLKRERQSGLSQAKRAAFIAQHGKLFCERCNLDPVEAFGEFGTACIEVHHIVPLSTVDKISNTKLDDLVCLCANCHRIIHRELRAHA